MDQAESRVASIASTISVPCDKCNGVIRFGDRVCPSCRADVPRELRLALETRLEASDVDYQDSQKKVRSAAAVVLVLGGIHLAWGIVAYISDHLGDMPGVTRSSDVALSLFIVNGAIGLAMIGCFFWARRSPLPALITASAVWGSVNVLAAVLTPLTILSGLLLKLLAALILVRGLASAIRSAVLLRKLTAVSSVEPVGGGRT